MFLFLMNRFKIVVLGFLVALAFNQPAYAGDVYNLYFKNPNEGVKATEKEEPKAKEEEKIAPPPPAVEIQKIEPKVETKAPEASKGNSALPPNIIINNNLTTQNPVAAEKTKAPAVIDDPTPHFVELPNMPPTSSAPPLLSFSVVAGAFVPDAGHSMDSFGLGINLGVHPTAWLGFNGWANAYRSLHDKDSYLGGGDLELTPFRLDSGNFSVLTVGLLGGVHTRSYGDEAHFPGHFGLRADLNFNRTFGLTTAVRVASKFFVTETGLVARF